MIFSRFYSIFVKGGIMKKILVIFYIAFAVLLFSENMMAQSQITDTDYANSTATVTASPNPFENEVTLTINEGQKKLNMIKIFDLIGKEVASIDLKNKSGLLTYRLDFSKLKPGVYFCNIYSDHGLIETKKLFKTSENP